MTTAVIPAAGAGSRLGDLGRRHSKAMLPVTGLPLIAWTIARLRTAGVNRLVVVGHSSDSELARYLAGEQRDATLVQQSERRGIADALRLALPSLAADEPYLACACDSIFAASDLAALIELGAANPAAAAIGVLEMGAQATVSRSGVRVEDGHVVEIVEKPAPGTMKTGLVSMPLYWLPPSFSRFLQTPARAGEHYVSTALAAFLADGGRVLASPVAYRLEITRAEDVAAVEAALVRSGAGG